MLSLLRSAYDPDNWIFTLGESIDGSQFILFTHPVDSCMTKLLESPRGSSDKADKPKSPYKVPRRNTYQIDYLGILIKDR